MIVCITPNVALDRTLRVPHYHTEGVFRATQVIVLPGGKGLNVARSIQRLRGAAVCGGFVGGYTGAWVSEMAANEGLRAQWTRIAGETRTCTAVVDPTTRETAIVNEPGPTVESSDWERLTSDTLRLLSDPAALAVCVCGSVPPSPDPDDFSAYLRSLLTTGKPLWVDTSGEALKAAQSVEGVRLKINGYEAASLVGAPVDSLEATVAALRTINARTHADVVITLGARGAVALIHGVTWRAYPSSVSAMSSIGSGDAFLAGLLLSLTSGAPAELALKRASAAGGANTLGIGAGQFTYENYQRLLLKIAVKRM